MLARMGQSEPGWGEAAYATGWREPDRERRPCGRQKRMGWTHMTFEDEIQSSVSLLTKAIEIVLQCNFFERS
jgi:hypothetical protein